MSSLRLRWTPDRELKIRTVRPKSGCVAILGDHEPILNASLTWTDKGLRTQLFAKWSFVLVCPTSLIQHKSKYSIIFPYLRCNVSESETIIYYVNYGLVLQSCSNGDTEGALMFGSLFYFDKVPPALSS